MQTSRISTLLILKKTLNAVQASETVLFHLLLYFPSADATSLHNVFIIHPSFPTTIVLEAKKSATACLRYTTSSWPWLSIVVTSYSIMIWSVYPNKRELSTPGKHRHVAGSLLSSRPAQKISTACQSPCFMHPNSNDIFNVLCSLLRRSPLTLHYSFKPL